MEITFEISGGFAYFPVRSKPFIIDTTQIDPQVAAQLESFVRESRFFDQPVRIDTTAKGSADYQTYTITVKDGKRIHTICLTDPINDANLERLASYLQSIAGSSTS